MADILLSVIVPVYNTKNYLKKCITSILNQTFTDFELILVNDGSTDGSELLCNEFAEKDKRIIFLNKSNEGLSSARNYGIKKAKGIYLSFIDSDDWIEKEMFRILISDLTNYNADIAGCNMYKVYEDGRRFYKNEIVFTEECVKVYYDKDVLKTFYKLFSVCNKIFKRTLFDNILFPEGKIYEDARTMYLLAAKANIATFSSYNGYNYLQRSTGITGSFNRNNYLDKVLVWDELYEYMKVYLPEELPYIIERKNKLIMYLIDNLHHNSSENCSELISKLLELIT